MVGYHSFLKTDFVTDNVRMAGSQDDLAGFPLTSGNDASNLQTVLETYYQVREVDEDVIDFIIIIIIIIIIIMNFI